MSKFFARFAKDESGATAIEYGLIVALLSVIIIGTITTIGVSMDGKFGKVADALK